MRTTIRLPDDLLRRVKAQAASEGRTLNAFIEDAVRHRVERPATPPRDIPPLPVSERTGWLRPGVSLDKVQDLFDAEDLTDGTFR